MFTLKKKKIPLFPKIALGTIIPDSPHTDFPTHVLCVPYVV